MIKFVIQLIKDTIKLSFTIFNYLINSYVVCEIKEPPDIDLDDIK